MKMKNKILFFVLFVLALTLTVSIGAFATEEETTTPQKEVIIVGETTDADGVAYTLESAWAYQSANAEREIEVVLKTDNANFQTNLASLNVANKPTVLQLTEDTTSTAAFTLVANAKITIDVSGVTYTSAYRMALYNSNSELTFRTSTAAGKIVGTNSSDGCLVRLDNCRSASAYCSLSLVGANSTDMALTYEGVELVQFESDAIGDQIINLKNLVYNSSKALLRTRKSVGNSNLTKVKLLAEDCNFKITKGEGFMWHNSTGLISLGSYFDFKNCVFYSGTSGTSANFFYQATGNIMSGRYFATFTFDDCDFTDINLNNDAVYSYANAVTAEDGTVSYDTNFPEGVSPTDYAATVAASGWDASKQVTFVGHNTFTRPGSSTLNSDKNGFVCVNTAANNNLNQWFYDSSNNITYLFGDEFDNATDLITLINMANTQTSKKAYAKLTADIDFAAISARSNIYGNIEIDLAGHTLTLGTVQNWTRGTLHVYSSEVGGVLLSNSQKTMFQLDVGGKPNLTFGRESDPVENMSVISTASSDQGGIIVFCSDYCGTNATINFYNTKIRTAKYLIKLNSVATDTVFPTTNFTFKGCDISLSYAGLLSFNELSPVDSPAHNGLFAVGSTLTVEDSTIQSGDGANLFFTESRIQTSTDEVERPNFQGRYYAKVTFKNTHFEDVHLNFGMLTSSKDNLATNGQNGSYVVPEDWDVSKQVTLLESCTFDMNQRTGVNAEGNGLTSTVNTVIADGYVFARTESADTFAILPESEVVNITWNLPDTVYTVAYKNGVSVYLPALPADLNLNGNTYSVAFETLPAEVALSDATYFARWTGGAKFSANYTLEAAIDFNAYVPTSDEIIAIGGNPVTAFETVTQDGTLFWKVTFADLAPKDAYKSQCVSLTVQADENTTVTVNRYVSILGYAKAALKSETNQELQTLVLRTLDYINQTSLYFSETSVSQIEEILTAYNFTSYVWEEKNVQEWGELVNAKYACLDLNQTPGFVFAVRADYEGDVVVNGVAYNDYQTGEYNNEQIKYVIVEIPVYRMADMLNVVIGEDVFTYNLDTYIAKNASSEPYAHALYGYIDAAMAYVD